MATTRQLGNKQRNHAGTYKEGGGAGPRLREANKHNQEASTLGGQSSINCSEEQQNEVEALRSIYMDDYEEVVVRGAWNRTSERAFKLRIRASSDRETFVTLLAKLTATYPKTLPLLSVEGAEGLRAKARQSINTVLAEKPKELVREQQPMIFDIASSIEEILEDEASSKGRREQMPSLEEERAFSEAAAGMLAKQQEVEDFRRKEEEMAEEDRMLKEMVDVEFKRQQEVMRRTRTRQTEPSVLTDDTLGGSEIVTFDRPVSVKAEDALLVFRSVTSVSIIARGGLCEVCLVRPVVSQAFVPSLVYKRAKIKARAPDSAMKEAIFALEEELDLLKTLREENVIGLYDFKIEKLKLEDGFETWQFGLLMEHANRGSLSDLLGINTLSIDKTKSWTRALLEAIDFYRRHGVAHRRIHPGNVLICRPASGGTIVKLADAAFQTSLHEFNDLIRANAKSVSARSAYWTPPELTQLGARGTHKTDVWDLGVVFLQMMFGLNVPEKYTSPSALMETLSLSEPLDEMIRRLFRPNPKKRPTAFELLPSDFLRNDVPIWNDLVPPQSTIVRQRMSATADRALVPQLRRMSTSTNSHLSRYAAEWDELGRIGKGGFGEVVRARNKLDGRVYAIKKIKADSAAALDSLLSEVMLLSRLNHPYVVRYYGARTEEDLVEENSLQNDGLSSTDETSTIESEAMPQLDVGHSTGGLDFISSGGYPYIEFGDDTDEEESSTESESDEHVKDSNKVVHGTTDVQPEKEEPRPRLQQVRSNSRVPSQIRTTLYIQMEYCERQTLRDVIRNDLHQDVDRSWRLLRQVVEDLTHIHGHDIIHRDLKPENIFIDNAGNPRIGDFGLATSGQVNLPDKAGANGAADTDLTRSLGTAFYIAPELKSGSHGQYTEKVDMYSLGIIFFEMSYPPLKTGMERHQILTQLRQKEIKLPTDFDKPPQAEIIRLLANHKPSERPSSAELLSSGRLPVQMEDETIRLALQGISDPHSPYYQKMMTALFSQSFTGQVKELTWDVNAGHAPDALMQTLVRDRLITIFQRHGAVEIQRQVLFPKSALYVNESIAQLLDPSGTLVQLPYDLSLPFARNVARQKPPYPRSFAFGAVFRGTHASAAPRASGEVDFDIVSYDTLDLAMKEAEAMKVLDEIVCEVPSLATAQICFHVNHSDLLDLIMDFCRIGATQRPLAKEIISKLNVEQNTWQRIRNELRAPAIGISSTSLDDLARFDFRDAAEPAFARLQSIFDGTDYMDRTHSLFAHLRLVLDFLKKFGVRRKTYISPLSSFKDKFYSGGIMFQCLYDNKGRAVLAAGGRYDRLIEHYRPRVQGVFTGAHAVGFNLGWERVVSSMATYQRKAGKAYLKKKEEDLRGHWASRRCDILVASFDPAILRSAGVTLVSDLWASDLSAELATDVRTIEELNTRYRDEKHSWWITIKHDAGDMALAAAKPDLKIRSHIRKEDTDIRSADLLSYFRAALRDRDALEGPQERAKLAPSHRPHSSAADNHTFASNPDRTAPVKVLMASHKAKKANKYKIIESAYARTAQLAQAWARDAPIAAVETRDEVLDAIRRDARLSDAESWRRVVQGVGLVEREYVGQVWELLGQLAAEGAGAGAGAGAQVAWLYNFRTGYGVLYDLGA